MGPDVGTRPMQQLQAPAPPSSGKSERVLPLGQGAQGDPSPQSPPLLAPSWIWDHVTRARRLLPSVGWAAGVPTLGSTASYPHPATRIGARRGLVALCTPVSIVQGCGDCIVQVLRGAGLQIPRLGIGTASLPEIQPGSTHCLERKAS